MVSVFDVAKAFLVLDDKKDASDGISNLKLQKLVYYAQGFHLAFHDTLFFPERIEAWPHGPVAPALYHEYKQYEGRPIDPPKDFDLEDNFSKEQIEILQDVHDVYGQFSGWQLRNISHEEPTWINNEADRNVISEQEMREYFKTRLK